MSILTTAESRTVRWPFVYGLKIESCQDNILGTCNSKVLYSVDGVSMRDVPLQPGMTGPTWMLGPFGLHCDSGNKIGEFNGCYWGVPTTLHTPELIGKCETTTPDGFILTDDSTCTVSTAIFGPHTGAGPGAECIMFGRSQPGSDASGFESLFTPWGVLNARDVANSPNHAFCDKAPPPTVTCTVDIQNGGVIDHGTMGPNDESIVSVPAAVNCGNTPEFLFNNHLSLGDGVTSELSYEKVSREQYLFKSTLRTSNAAAGQYKGTTIILVSPE